MMSSSLRWLRYDFTIEGHVLIVVVVVVVVVVEDVGELTVVHTGIQ